MMELVVLAAIILAWRARIFFKTLAILLFVVAFFSIQEPLWLIGLMQLYLDRFVHPRPADSILLLPGWPWAQFILMAVGIIVLVVYIWKSNNSQPTLWLWCVLILIGIISALHTYTYDWVILMLPLAWLLRSRRLVFLVVGLYLYPFLWAILSENSIPVPSPVIIPSAILICVLLTRMALRRNGTLTRVTDSANGN